MKNKLLPWIIALTALSVSVSAAFYSVTGLGKMFAGASTEVMILAGSLELAKLVTASLLYQYWKKLNLGLKLYLSFATLVLIIITSAGIYGFLSSAYQETSFKVQTQDKNIEILDKNIYTVEKEIKNYESQASAKEKRVLQLTQIRSDLQNTQDVLIERSRSIIGVRQQIKDVDSEIKRIDSEIAVINDSISSKNTRISAIETQKLEVSSDKDLAGEVGPLKYIAGLTGSSIDKVVNWYIIVLMIVFDPLAIALVVAANFAFSINGKKEDKEEIPMKKTKNPLKGLWSKITNTFSKKKNDLNDPVTSDRTINNTDIIEPNKSEEIKIQEKNIKNQEENKPIEEVLSEYHPTLTGEIVEAEENTENVENKSEKEDTYNDHIILENQKILRDKFRGTPDSMGSRESFRNTTGGNQNPLNLR
jgi:hypothetical protein